MRPAFIYRGKLPGFNEYQTACRSSWAIGARMKREATESVAWTIKAQGVRRYGNPVKLTMIWHEPPAANGHRRDLDNIVAAKKFILDAMTATLVIHDDDLDHVTEITDRVVQEPKGESYGVEVYIQEEERGW